MPSKIQELEKKLPFLPGHTFRTELNNYRKSHAFDFFNSVPVVRDSKPGIGGGALLNQVQDEEKTLTSVDFLQNKSKLDEKSKVAGWIAFDKQVLRFYAFFREEFPESQTEPFRIRKVNIYFYIEDDSMHVSEPRIANSGLPQGTLIRRHRIPIPDSPTNQHYTIVDLNVGQELSIYARKFTIVGCDEFTRRFLSGIDIQVPANGQSPADSFEILHKKAPAPKAPMQRLIPSRPTASLKKFLENDRQVLRFYCVWDDSAAKFGDVHSMVLHYFLADDTIEVREQHLANNNATHGHVSIPTTVFLKRHRLSKRPIAISVDESHLSRDSSVPDSELYYCEKDFTIGSVVNFYGRTFVVCDCDDFTKEHYQEKYNITTFKPIQFSEYGCIDPDTGAVVTKTRSDNNDRVEHDPDQVMSFSSSNNAPKNGKKKGVDENIVLRFAATLKSDKQVDKDRKFVISYYYVNDTFQVFEKQHKNSGIKGGKFLERSKMKKPDGSGYYGPSDVAIGAVLTFWSHQFVLTGGDEFSNAFMARNPHVFTS